MPNFEAELDALLLPVAAKYGYAIEIEDRRGTGIVGIKTRPIAPTANHRAVDWMDELDGLSFADALPEAKRLAAIMEKPFWCQRCHFEGLGHQLIDGECCPSCRLVLA